MSEPSFPFQGTQVAEAPAAEQQEARNTRRTLLVLAVVGVLVLGALAYFFLLSGGEDADDSAAPVRKQGTVEPTPEPSATEPPAPAQAPKLSKKAVGKDPFEALVVPAVEGGGGGGAVDPVTAPLGGGGQVPVTGGDTGNAGNNGNNGNNGNGNGNGNGGSTSDTPLTVKVVSVAGDNTSARVAVSSKTYSVAVGDVFGTYFKTLRLKNGKCGSFTYGDERFDLCEGETARMQ